ncbi:MAG: excinuclease ABC subunit UvrA [Syntrophaceae bacterium]|nr:excinuclease ABC subunit UvrA [Syntrophaceae bacterium]
MSANEIRVRGADTHNLKHLDVDVPKGKLVVFTGVSGSGKSSLVFDTIYTEAQRQLIETFSSFARRRLPKLSRPPVASIENISTAIVIDQKRMGRNLRSTVGTATEIFTYLRLLYSRCGSPQIGPSFYFSFNHPEGMCPDCQGLGKRIRVKVEKMLDTSKSLREGAVMHPDFKVEGWNWREIVGSEMFPVDIPVGEFTPAQRHDLLYADKIPFRKKHGAGTYAKTFTGIARRLEQFYLNKAEDELPDAKRTAYDEYLTYANCEVCGGTRLNPRARGVQLQGRGIDEISAMELEQVDAILAEIRMPVAQAMVKKMRQIIGHLLDIGVGYLSLDRAVATLSGGESQRIKMARQLDCDLVDMLYILDEPSIGLHPKDNSKLIGMLQTLRDKGNSVLVVEHDPDIIRAADWVIEIGPQAGRGGGRLLYHGGLEGLQALKTPTGRALAKTLPEAVIRKPWNQAFEIRNAKVHNLKNISTRIPEGVLTCITGVAGSGKSTLIHEVFVPAHPDAVVVDQTAIAKSSRSIPVSYLGIFDAIRKEIAGPTGADPGWFSFNSKGACPKCNGAGVLSIEMNFMDDVKMICDECQGRKYQAKVLALKYQGKSMDEILELTASEAKTFFKTPEIIRRLQVLCDVGLDYIEIGQALSTLSGGESQRLKLATELHKQGRIYVLDEPTTGLHRSDTQRLLAILRRMTDHHNTVVVIEHNLDVIWQADWVIDLGPDGGRRGGEILAEGAPETVAACEESRTGKYLKQYFMSGHGQRAVR